MDHPDKLKDKEEMQKNRQHVMLDYLEKKRSKSTGNASWVSSDEHGRKRKRIGASSQSSLRPTAPTIIFRSDSARVIVSASDSSSANFGGTSDDGEAIDVVRPALTVKERDGRVGTTGAFGRQRTSVHPDVATSLVAGVSGRYYNQGYRDTEADDVPFTISGLGSSLNPFKTWPKFSEPSIDIAELKWSCAYTLTVD